VAALFIKSGAIVPDRDNQKAVIRGRAFHKSDAIRS
jgi:hypothetical protein